MKRNYSLTQKIGTTFAINPTCYSITAKNIAAQTYFQEKNEWLLLEIEHGALQTQIDLSNLPDYVLVFLENNDSNWKVAGATYCLNKNEGAFGILTPFRKILFIPYEAMIDVNSLTQVTLDTL